LKAANEKQRQGPGIPTMAPCTQITFSAERQASVVDGYATPLEEARELGSRRAVAYLKSVG
jgi:hypothetical protein